MFNRRWSCCLIICLVLAMSMVGEAAKVKIRHAHDVYHQQDWTNWLRAAKQKFEAQNPDIEVEILVQGRNEQLEKLILLYGTDEGPDVIETFPSQHYNLALAGMFADLDSYMDNDQMLSWDEFFPVSVDAATIIHGERAGERWMLPLSLWIIGAAFNDTHFDESGVLVPSQYNYTWTWDDFADIAKKMIKVDASGNVTRYGCTFSSWQTWVHNAGGFMYYPYTNPTEITMNTEPVRKALDFLQNVHGVEKTVGHFPYPENFTRQEASVFLHAGPSITPILRRSNVNWEWSYGPNPKLERAGSENLTIGVAMSSASTKQDAAWRWMKFLATEAASDHIMITGRPTAWQPGVEDYQAYFPQASAWEYVWIELLASPDSYNRPVVNSDIARVINDHVWAVIRGEEATEVGMAKAQEQATGILKAMNQ
ncbi:MAG: extracellular solute-binding protein [Limnochordia bacterium]|nr:extracellular solute-binding protein [Limnochordia bacterium]MDD4517998.1 extracellular solute-binding protein [Limnochordia bacterium]